MKTRTVRGVVLAIAVLLAWMSGTCRAETISLSLSSDDDLANVPVGQTVTIKVNLSGLEPGDQLEYLAAMVDFDAAILGTPTVTAGPIVPDLNGFLSGGFPGAADGTYDSLLSGTFSAIEENGVFYSFEVEALSVGTADISFDFVDADDNLDPFDAPPVITLGDPLPFTATPEPTELVALGSLLLTGLAFGLVRRRRHSRVRSED